MLTATQKRCFETFGYLKLPGLLADDIAWIQREFEAVWAARRDLVHDGSKRSEFPGSFIDQNERLCTLLEHPCIDPLITDLLGEGWGYYGGNGNLYSGDTGWHCDAIPPDVSGIEAKRVVRHLKVAFYLDPVGRDSGALRVIPGSHRWQEHGYREARDALFDCPDQLGMHGRDVPAIAVDLVPGDVVCFDHLLSHSSFGGSSRRRMFTINTFEACRDEARRRANETVFAFYGGLGATTFWGEVMLRTAGPARLRRIDAARPFVPAMAAIAAQRAAAGTGQR